MATDFNLHIMNSDKVNIRQIWYNKGLNYLCRQKNFSTFDLSRLSLGRRSFVRKRGEALTTFDEKLCGMVYIV